MMCLVWQDDQGTGYRLRVANCHHHSGGYIDHRADCKCACACGFKLKRHRAGVEGPRLPRRLEGADL